MNATQSTVQALAFTWGQGNAVVPVFVTKQPVAREALEQPLPVITVSPVRPEEVEQASTGGYVSVRYSVQIGVIAPGNAAFEANLSTYLGWRESLRLAFQRVVYPSIPSLWRVQVRPQDVLNRDLERDNYDFSILQIEFETYEKAAV